MRYFFLLFLLCAAPFQSFAREYRVALYDIDAAAGFDVTEFFVDSFQHLTNITAVNTGNGEGDEWLVFTDGTRICVWDSATFSPLFELSESDLRRAFSLPDGTGILSALTLPGKTADALMYFDTHYNEYYALDFTDNTFRQFGDIQLPDGFVTGFSYTSVSDVGILNKSTTGEWFYESLDDPDPISLELSALFDGNPSTVTEFEITFQGMVYRYLLAVLPGNTEATPTPGGQPTPTPGGQPTPTPTHSPGSEFKAVIADSLGEDLWVVNSWDYTVDPGVALTGQSPDQIVVQDNRFYVVNSLSHSIGIYTTDTFQPAGEISVGMGRNPMYMRFLDADRFYVTNFTSNTVSLVSLSAAGVQTEIDLPAAADLPHDAGQTTSARPGGLVIIDDTCYVACANLNESFVAGGPGIIATIDTHSHQLTGWFESGGRDTVDVVQWPEKPDWLWTVNAGDFDSGTGFAGNGSIAVRSISQAAITDIIPVNDAPFELVFGEERAYFASGMDGRIGRIDPRTLSLLEPLELPNAGQGLNFVSGLTVDSNGILWALEFNHDMLYLIDTRQNDAIIRQIEVGDGPDAIAFIGETGRNGG